MRKSPLEIMKSEQWFEDFAGYNIEKGVYVFNEPENELWNMAEQLFAEYKELI